MKRGQTSIATTFLLAALLLLSVLLLAGAGMAQEEDGPGRPAFSDPHPASITLQQNASNIELLTQIGGPVLDVAVAGPYAYIGMGPRLVVLNVSDPSRPTLVGQSEVMPGIVKDVAVVGQYVYLIGDEYRARLWILSVADPTHPTVVNSVDFQAAARRVAIAGNRAYVTVAEKGLQIFDISNPVSPTLLGEAPTIGSFLAVAGNYAYVLGSRLYIVDVTNPYNPTQVGVYTYTLPTGASLHGIAVEANHAYIAKGNYYLEIVNVSDPSRPAPVLTYTVRAFGIALSGRYAYVADTNALHIVDVSNPSSPTQVGYCHLPWGLGTAVALAGDYAYVANESGGLRIVRVADPSRPTETARFFVMEYAEGVAWKDNYLYVPQLLTYTRIVQVTDPSHPVVVGTYPVFSAAPRVVGNRLYLADRYLHILDVSDPARPVLLGRTDAMTDSVRYIFVAGNYAYLIVQYKGLCIVDISDPYHPVRRGCYQNSRFISVAVDGNYAYVGGRDLLAVLDVSNPDAPVLRSQYEPLFDYINDVAVAGDYLYATAMGDFRIFRRNDPYTPTLLTTYYIGSGDALVLRDNLAYVADNYRGVRVINVSDPHRPVEVGFYDTPGWTFHLDVAGDIIYAADFAGGLFILRFVPPSTAVIPPSGGTLTSPRDRTTLTFPPDTFTDTVVITYTPRSAPQVPSPGDLAGIGHFFEVTAVYSTTGRPAQPAPGKRFTITVGYTDSERGPVVENTLALYTWANGRWQKEETSQVDPIQKTVIARPDHLSLWGVLGETRRVYLPAVLRNR